MRTSTADPLNTRPKHMQAVGECRLHNHKKVGAVFEELFLVEETDMPPSVYAKDSDDWVRLPRFRHANQHRRPAKYVTRTLACIGVRLKNQL